MPRFFNHFGRRISEALSRRPKSKTVQESSLGTDTIRKDVEISVQNSYNHARTEHNHYAMKSHVKGEYLTLDEFDITQSRVNSARNAAPEVKICPTKREHLENLRYATLA